MSLSITVNIAKYKHSLYLGGRHRSRESCNFCIFYMLKICHLKGEREEGKLNLEPKP